MEKKHVFLAYAKDNQKEARSLYNDLRASDLAVWWDQEIPLGGKRSQETLKAIHESYAFLVCFSSENPKEEIDSSESQKEEIYSSLREAIGIYRNHSPEKSFLFPIRFSECELPFIEIDKTTTLNDIQHLDLFPAEARKKNLSRLIQDLQQNQPSKLLSPPPKPLPEPIEGPVSPDEDFQYQKDLEELMKESFAPLLIESIARIWVTSSLSELEDIAGKSYGKLLRKVGKREAEGLGATLFYQLEQAVVSLFQFLPLRFPKHYGIQIMVVKTIRETLEKQSASYAWITESEGDPKLLQKQLKGFTPHDFNPTENEEKNQLYNQYCFLVCELLIDLYEALPPWSSDNLLDLLKNEDLMLGRCREILKTREEEFQEQKQEQGDLWLQSYYRATARQFDQLNLFGIDLKRESRRYQLSVAYISLTLEEINLDSTQQSLESLAMEESFSPEEALHRFKRLLILGEAGQGKTTLMHWITVKCSRQEFTESLSSWNQKVPFFIPLRRVLGNKNLPQPEDFLKLMLPNHDPKDVPQQWVRQELNAGNGILMVDGFDEVPLNRRSEVVEWLKKLCRQFPKNRLFLTSRPSAYETDKTLLEGLGFKGSKLQAMTNHSIASFVDHWHQAVSLALHPDLDNTLREEAQELLLKLEKVKSLRSLVTNPLLCAVICALHHDRHGYLPSNRTEIYEATCQMFLDRRDLERKVEEENLALKNLTYTDKRTLLNSVAYWMMGNNKTSLEEKNWVLLLEKKVEFLGHLQGKNLSGKILLKYFLDRSGLLARVGKNEIQFTHRTFQEYMGAQAFVDNSQLGYLQKQIEDDYWHETIQLALGLCPTMASNQFLVRIFKQSQKLEQNKKGSRAVRLILLAMLCCEGMREIDPRLKKAIEQKIQAVVPPLDSDRIKTLVAAQELALPFLKRERGRTIKEDFSCAITLLKMNLKEATPFLLPYLENGDSKYIEALAKFLKKIARDQLEKMELIEILLNKGNEDYPLPILKSLFSVSLDPRLYQNLPKETFSFFTGKTFGLVSFKGSYRYSPPKQEFCFDLLDGKFLSSIQSLKIKHLSIQENLSQEELAVLPSFSHLESMKIEKLVLKDGKFLSSIQSLKIKYLLIQENLSQEELAVLLSFSHLESMKIEKLFLKDGKFLNSIQSFKIKELFIQELNEEGLIFLLNSSHFESVKIEKLFLKNGRLLHTLQPFKIKSLSIREVSNITALQSLQQLEFLNLYNTQVSDITALQSLQQLEFLNLYNTHVRDLTPLKGLRKLKKLYVNSHVDISPLKMLMGKRGVLKVRHRFSWEER